MAHWTALAARRPVVGIAGVDAHAKLDFANADAGDNRFSIPLRATKRRSACSPSMSRRSARCQGTRASMRRSVMRAIRAGHLYTAVDGLASPPAFEFTATNMRGTAHQGDELGVGGRVSLHVRSNAPPGYKTILWRGSEILKAEASNELSIEAGRSRPSTARGAH